jgi:hypothetical protein
LKTLRLIFILLLIISGSLFISCTEDVDAEDTTPATEENCKHQNLSGCDGDCDGECSEEGCEHHNCVENENCYNHKNQNKDCDNEDKTEKCEHHSCGCDK